MKKFFTPILTTLLKALTLYYSVSAMTVIHLSIFPGSPLLEGKEQNWVNAVYNEEQQMYRITLTPVIVNRASHIAFMVAGPNKAKILKEVIEGKYMPSTLPAQLIKPENGELHWFLDKETAKKLSNTE